MASARLSRAIHLALIVSAGALVSSGAVRAEPAFSDRVIATDADGASSATAVDLDGDGDLDILATAAVDTFQLIWFENDGNQNFTRRTISSAMPFAYSAVAVDVNGDTHLDVVATSQAGDKVSWFENDGFEGFSERVISTLASGARDAVALDLDGDTDIDVVSVSRTDNTLAWYENDGSENFTARTLATDAVFARDVMATDLDDDGDQDLLVASQNNDRIAWYENDGSENFSVRTITALAVDAAAVATADLDGDGDQDVLSASITENEIAWYENDGNEGFTVRTISTGAVGAVDVLAADLDGDGDVDVASASFADDKIAWYENDGSQNFTEHTISLAGDLASTVAAGDIDGDGDLDLVSASGSDDTITWHENDSVGVRIFDIGAREGPPNVDFTGPFASVAWSTFIEESECAMPPVDELGDQVVLRTSDFCSDLVVTYTHQAGFSGAPFSGVATFDYAVSDNSSHTYFAEAGVTGGEPFLLSDSTPKSGRAAIPVPRGGRLFFRIGNDGAEGTATLSITNFTFGEPNIAIVVERGLGNPISVQAAVDPGTAEPFDDYTPTGAFFNLGGFDGETVLLNVPIVDDSDPETDEQFTARLFNLSGPGNVLLVDGGEATVTINGNDAVMSLLPNPSVIEGDSGFVDLEFTIQVAGDAVPPIFQPAGNFSISTTNDGTATPGFDFNPSGQGQSFFTLLDGDTFTFNAQVIGDEFVEPDETVGVELSVSSSLVSLGNGMALGIIINDDLGAGTLSVNNPVVDEGDTGTTPLLFDVTLTGDVAGGFTVPFSLSGGSAEPDVDYTNDAGLLTFGGSSGETVQVAVDVLGDTIFEPDETLGFQLGTPSSGNVTVAGSGIGGIRNDDARVGAFFPEEVAEGAGFLTASVRLEGVVPGGTIVSYSTADGISNEFFGDGARAGEDYEETFGELTFVGFDGETLEVPIPILDDGVVEDREYLQLLLTETTNDVEIPVGFPAFGYILDDDSAEPPNLEDAAFMVVTSAASGTVLGQLVFDDPNGDIPATGAFAIIAGDPGGAFAVSDGGAVFLADPAALVPGEQVLSISITDEAGLLDVATVTIAVLPPAPRDPDTLPPIPGAEPGDRAGTSVSLDGGALVVGVPGAGSVAVYDVRDGRRALVSELRAPQDAASGFGNEVLVTDEFLLVGTGGDAAAKGDPLTTQIYRRLGLGFTGFAEIKRSQAFGGGAIAFDRSIALIGNPATSSVNLFRLDSEGVQPGPIIFPAPGGKGGGGLFGKAIGVDADRAAVGAPGSELTRGTVSLFQLVSSNLGLGAEPAAVPSLSGEPGEGFGSSVALEGSMLAIGAPGSNGSTGRVFLYGVAGLFQNDGSGAPQPIVLDPPAGDVGGGFGEAVHIAGDFLVVGSPRLQGAGGQGVVYRYRLDALEAGPGRRISAPAGSLEFGADVDGGGDGTIVGGAPGTEQAAGRAFIEGEQLFRNGFEGS